MIKLLNRHPWIYLVIAFSVLIASWVVLFILAGKYAPEKIPLETTHNLPKHER